MRKALVSVLIFFFIFGTTSSGVAVETDGLIQGGEYDLTFSYHGGDVKLYVKIQSPYVYFGVDAATAGWIGIGFDPVAVMDQADMIIGWVDVAGKAYGYDCFSTGLFGPHPRDTDLGGTEDILAFGGKEQGGRTILEFKRLLVTGDSYDKPIDPTKSLNLIWAYGKADHFEDMHIAAGSATIDLPSGVASQRQGTRFLILHILFMSFATLVMALGVTIARFYRKKKWWLKVHRAMGIIAALSAGVGLGSIVMFVENTRSGHFKVPHAWVGVVALIGAFSVPIVGQVFLTLKKGKKEIRQVHRWGGRITLALMGMAAIMGLKVLGLF